MVNRIAEHRIARATETQTESNACFVCCRYPGDTKTAAVKVGEHGEIHICADCIKTAAALLLAAPAA